MTSARQFMTVSAMLVAFFALGGFATAADIATADTSGACDRFDTLLERYVTPQGVRYDEWRRNADDGRALNEIVAKLAGADPSTLSSEDRHALYINLYNARIIQIVLTENPPESIRDVTWTWFGYGVFFRDDLEFDGKRISLNQLEKRLRRESGDPRIHFAVNCASRSCPPLAGESYRGSRLDAQLEVVTRAFLASPVGLSIEEPPPESGRVRLRVSKIFKWFDEDFTSSGGVLAFIRRYAPPETARRLGEGSRVKLAYQNYDWSLNREP